LDTFDGKKSEITVVFKITVDDWKRAEVYIQSYKNRHYWAKNAFLEKVARLEGMDRKAREQRVMTDAAYINDLIKRGLISLDGKEA
jgi:hypothetical protein